LSDFIHHCGIHGSDVMSGLVLLSWLSSSILMLHFMKGWSPYGLVIQVDFSLWHKVIPNKCEFAPMLWSNTQHKSIWVNGVQIHPFLTLALDGGEWSAACSSYFTCKGRTTGTY
jgi:hypothetical protein